MLYCEICMILVQPDADKCPECRHKKLRAPTGNDPTYLLSKEILWSGGIEEALKEHGIPCLKKSSQGTAFNVIFGQFGDVMRFYVPFAALEKSRELLAGFLDEDEDDDALEYEELPDEYEDEHGEE